MASQAGANGPPLPPERGEKNGTNTGVNVTDAPNARTDAPNANDDVYTLDKFRKAKVDGTFDHIVLVHHSLKSDEIPTGTLIKELLRRAKMAGPVNKFIISSSTLYVRDSTGRNKDRLALYCVDRVAADQLIALSEVKMGGHTLTLTGDDAKATADKVPKIITVKGIHIKTVDLLLKEIEKFATFKTENVLISKKRLNMTVKVEKYGATVPPRLTFINAVNGINHTVRLNATGYTREETADILKTKPTMNKLFDKSRTTVLPQVPTSSSKNSAKGADNAWELRDKNSTKVRNNSDSVITCFYCGNPGHIKRDCPVIAERASKIKCYNCGLFGHVAAKCQNAKMVPVCFACKEKGHEKWQIDVCRVALDKINDQITLRKKRAAELRDRINKVMQEPTIQTEDQDQNVEQNSTLSTNTGINVSKGANHDVNQNSNMEIDLTNEPKTPPSDIVNSDSAVEGREENKATIEEDIPKDQHKPTEVVLVNTLESAPPAVLPTAKQATITDVLVTGISDAASGIAKNKTDISEIAQIAVQQALNAVKLDSPSVPLNEPSLQSRTTSPDSDMVKPLVNSEPTEEEKYPGMDWLPENTREYDEKIENIKKSEYTGTADNTDISEDSSTLTDNGEEQSSLIRESVTHVKMPNLTKIATIKPIILSFSPDISQLPPSSLQSISKSKKKKVLFSPVTGLGQIMIERSTFSSSGSSTNESLGGSPSKSLNTQAKKGGKKKKYTKLSKEEEMSSTNSKRQAKMKMASERQVSIEQRRQDKIKTAAQKRANAVRESRSQNVKGGKEQL